MIKAQKCSCGGHLHKVDLKKVEIAPFFGLRGVITGPVASLQCDKCGEKTFEAAVLDRMLMVVTRAVLMRPTIMSSDEARFLRKAVLRLTQNTLADRMGINMITVADWERGERPISKEHDYELRGIALADLLRRDQAAFTAGERETLAGNVEHILAAPRLRAAPQRSKRYVIPSMELAAA